MTRSLVVCLLVACVGAEVPAQVERSAVAAALRAWVAEYNRGSLPLAGKVTVDDAVAPEYARVCTEANLFRGRLQGRQTTHYSMLERLVGLAEMRPGAEIAAALLPVAAAGFERNLYDSQVVTVRDSGRFALLRADAPVVWQHLVRVARGEVAARAATETEDGEVERDVFQRIAAIQLLGSKRKPGFRAAVEKCLSSGDHRVRLAAGEALASMASPASIGLLTRATRSERHPVVAQAMVHAIDRILKRHAEAVPAAARGRAVASLRRTLGRAGWRNDVGIVRLLRKHREKASVPALINVLRGAPRSGDPLLKIINKDASPVLAHEAWLSLRRLTGAILPQDPKPWQEFWESEKDKFELPPVAARRPATATVSKGTFYGIPVLGREVVFVIDSSGSMREPAFATMTVAQSVKKPNPRRRRKGAVTTRLDYAKKQVLGAVQGIDRGTRYHLVTFAGEVYIWNHKPVPALPRTLRTLTEVLSRIEANGGTNVFAALLHVLNASQMRYGQEIKNKVDEVFILSDGEPSVGQLTQPEAILRQVRGLNKYQKIRIHTVFTGSGRGAQFMRDLAAQNHGVFVQR